MTDKQTPEPKPPTPPPPPVPKVPAPKVAAHVEEAPILPGYEGDGSDYVTVTLTSSTIDQGTPFRIAKTPELPLSLAMGGSRYLISDHAKKLYVWQVK